MRRTSVTHFFIDKSMQDLYEKIQNLSPHIVFNKYNHELVREKPSPCLSRAKSKNLPWLHYQHLQIATTSTHRTSATHFSSTDQCNTPTKRMGTFPYKEFSKKYKHELVREKPSHCLSGANSKNLPWLRSPPHKKEIATAIC